MVKRSFSIQAAVDGAGGVTKLADALGLTVSAISQWRVVPPLRVLAVEKASGVPRWVLRPDIYPPLDNNEAAA